MADILSNLLLHWPMQDNAANTTVVDISGNGQHGTLSNGGQTTAQRSFTGGPTSWLSRCLFLSGNSPYASHITLGAHLTSNPLSALTSCIWFRGNFSVQTGTIVGEFSASTNNRGWRMATGNPTAGRMSTQLSADGTATSGKIYEVTSQTGDGLWHHLAFTFGSGTLLLYVDGSLATVTQVDNDAVTNIFASTANLRVLGNANGTDGMNASVADLRIFARTLTGEDVLAIMNDEGPPDESPEYAFHRFGGVPFGPRVGMGIW